MKNETQVGPLCLSATPMLPLCDWQAQGDIYHTEADGIPRMQYAAPLTLPQAHSEKPPVWDRFSLKSVGVWFAQIVINHPTKKDFKTEISLIRLDKLQ